MKKINQTGRSMVEMLGVLAIIGILSIGGISIVGRAKQSHDISQLIADTAQVAMISKKLSCQYDAAYGTYTNFLVRSQAYPDSFELEDGSFYAPPTDAKFDITGTKEAFAINISEMSEGACVALASTNWGKTRTSGFLGACFNNCSQPAAGNDTVMDPSTAAEKCDENATLKLWYKGC